MTEFNYETLTSCPVCYGMEFVPVMRADFAGDEMVYNQCLTCKCRWLETRMMEDDLHLYYQNYYRKLVNKSASSPDEDRKLQKIRGSHLAQMCNQLGLSPSTILDVGCSTGEVLHEFKKIFPDCTLHGVEWGDVDRHIAKQSGLDVYPDYVEAKYDIIVLSHVLEHTNHPTKFLMNLVENHMTDDGVLVIEVPNYEATMHAYRPHHPIAYNKESLHFLLDSLELRIAYGELHAVPFNSPLSINLTMVAEKR